MDGSIKKYTSKNGKVDNMYPYKIFHRNTQHSYTMAVSYMPSSPFEFISPCHHPAAL